MNEKEQFSAIPMGAIFRAANELATEGLIENWALGGALAGVYYTEPVATYDADIYRRHRRQRGARQGSRPHRTDAWAGGNGSRALECHIEAA
jgi:hypothetical protein